ncbi:MAG TPA: c-type cytochrome [Rhodanobacteraceae bacterium]|nr:c-type cytochrome [Rhodanobacteraceae bacterium]
MIVTTRAMVVVPIALLAMVIGVALAAPPFDDLRKQAPIHGDAAAGATRAAVCAACHGGDGIAVAPTFPNLAGQSATYLYAQLRAFKDGARANAVMQPLAKTLTDQDMRDLAVHFASLPGRPGPQAARESSRGASLFHDGDATKGVPPCQGCHGIDGRGPRPDPTSTAPQPAWSTFPVLAGQNAPYVLEQLRAYHDGTRTGTSNDKVMQGVARNLGAADMQALADYVAGLSSKGGGP